MANETQYTDLVTLAAAVDARIVPMFTSQVIGPRLVVPFNPDVPNTRNKDLPISGNVTASVVAEISAATSQTLTDTKTSLTLKKAVVLFRPSLESVRFASGTDPERLAQLAGQACAERFDKDFCLEFRNATNSVDAGATMTVAAIQQAAYKVRSGKVPASRIACVLNYKQAYEVSGDIRNSSGAFYGNPGFSPERALDGAQPVPGFLGKVFGIEMYETGNTESNGGDHIGSVFAPDFAYAALFPSGTTPSFETEIAPQTEIANSILNIRTIMWYVVKEYVDAAHCFLRSDVA